MSAYPETTTARDRFVLARRAARPRHDPWRHQGLLVEEERAADGRLASVATLFLTGRECPWRCVMCDLWRYTIAEDTPSGAIPAQIEAARQALRAQASRGGHEASQTQRTPATQGEVVSAMKLYNAGSFFDPRAVPESDYDAVAARLAGLERVIVESHPALIGPRVDRLLDALTRGASGGAVATTESDERLAGAACGSRDGRVEPVRLEPVRLEVAMGLETAHPRALERLHKRITVDRFARAAEGLRRRGVDLRVFLLIAPPFVPQAEQQYWLLRSLDVAWACGASAVSLIPTRPGNGAIDALAAEGLFHEPDLHTIERAFEAALRHGDSDHDGDHDGDRDGHGHARGRVFLDLWDLQRFSRCASCFEARRARLHAMNLQQRVPDDDGVAGPVCRQCDGGA